MALECLLRKLADAIARRLPIQLLSLLCYLEFLPLLFWATSVTWLFLTALRSHQDY